MNKTEQTYYPDDLITAYLNNELNKEQRVELEQWVAADTAHKQYFYEMTEVWLAANAASGTQEESNRAFQHFRGRISVSQRRNAFHCVLSEWRRQYLQVSCCWEEVITGGITILIHLPYMRCRRLKFL